MKLLVPAVLLFLVALGDFLWRGLDAYEQGAAAHAELLRRQSEMRDLRAELRVTGRAEVEALHQENERLAALVEAWRATLLGTGGNAPPDLDTLMASSRVPAFADGASLATSLRSQAAVSGRARALLARLAEAVVRSGLVDVEAVELTGGGAEVPIPDVPGCVQIEGRLIVTGDLDEVLECLESLAPGTDRPLLTVTQATLRRIEPDRWGRLDGLTGPPVRLTASVAAIFPDAEEVGG